MPANILVHSGPHHSRSSTFPPSPGIAIPEPSPAILANVHVTCVLAALRAPTLLPTALFEAHWTWWLAGAALGAVLLFVGLRRPEARLLRAGQALLGITILWVVAAFAFDTPGERLYKAHTTLAAAAEKQDVATILSYLDNNFVADGGDLGQVAMNHENARQVMGEILHEYTPHEIHITAYRLDPLAAGTEVTHIIVIANLTNVGLTKSYWAITWEDQPAADWRMTRLAAESPPQQAAVPGAGP